MHGTFDAVGAGHCVCVDCDGVSAGVQTGTPEEIREFVRKKKQAGDCGVEPMAALISANSLWKQ
jgi:hypothetical protein